MFDSKVSDWNIVKRTPYGKDPLKQLADEAHKQGIKLFFYTRNSIGTIPITTPAAQPLGTTAVPTAAILIPTSTIT